MGTRKPKPPIMETAISAKTLSHMKAHVMARDLGVDPERIARASESVTKTAATQNPLVAVRKRAVKALSIPEIVERLGMGYKVYVSAQKRSQSAKQQTRFIVRTHLGYHKHPEGVNDLTWDCMRAEIAIRADGIIEYLISGKDPLKLTGADKVVACRVSELITLNHLVWSVADTMIRAKGDGFATLCEQLPVYDALRGLSGFGPCEMARLIGECGDLWNYPSVAALWARMGLAVMPDGTRQRRVRGPAALDHGFSPRRRRQAFYFSRSVFIKDSNWTDVKHGHHPAGEWRLLYDRKKAEYLERGWRLKRAHNGALRYLCKCIIKFIYKEWLRTMPKPGNSGADNE